MQHVILGRTGLRVGVAGLGCGGFSRLGLGNGGSEANAIRVVRTALDLGVNLLDTAAVYGTEDVVGQAITDVPRAQVVIATKAQANRGDTGTAGRNRRRQPARVAAPAANGLCRYLPAARCSALGLSPLPATSSCRPCLLRAERERAAAFAISA